MTIDLSNNDPRISYSVSQGATQTSFTIPFEFFDSSDVTVYVDDALKTEGSDYTIATGVVSMSVTGATGGSQVVLVRHVPLERVTDFVAGQDINRAALNEQLDTLVAQVADLDNKVDRTIHLSDSEVAPSMLLTSDRKGRVLAFNSTTGDVEAGPLSNDIETIADNIVEILAADDEAAAAAASATSAANSATDAQTAQTAAELAETNAETAETNAAASAVTATSEATTATTKASEAATSASNAATSESNAASSATAAAGSATIASAASDAALAALDSFDDRYLGQKASDPTLDNDGNALAAGALYFNATDDAMKVYDGSVWVAAYASLSGALLQANNLSDVLDVTASRTNLGLGTGNTPTFAGINTTGTVNGRDVAADGSKLDGIEAGANVTDTANVTAAGALMDSEVANLAQVKAFNSADYATAAQGSRADSALLSTNNLSDVVNASAAILNLGITATASELNSLDGITGVASQADAQAGTSNALLMTPLRVFEAINSAQGSYVKSGVWSGAVSGDLVLFDTSSSSATLTLPASPVLGDVIYVVALSTLVPSKTMTIERNGSLINGDVFDLVYNENMPSIALFYNGSSWISHITSIATGFSRPFIPDWNTPDISMTASGVPAIPSDVLNHRGVWCYLVGGGGCGNNAAVYQSGWGFGGSGGRAHLHYTTVGRLRGASVTVGAGVTNSGSWQATPATVTSIDFLDLTSISTGSGGPTNVFSVDVNVNFASTSVDQTSTYFSMSKTGAISTTYPTATLGQHAYSTTGPDTGGPNWIFSGSEGYGVYDSEGGGTTNGTSVYAGDGNSSNGALGTFPAGGGAGSTYVNTALGHGANGMVRFYLQP